MASFAQASQIVQPLIGRDQIDVVNLHVVPASADDAPLLIALPGQLLRRIVLSLIPDAAVHPMPISGVLRPPHHKGVPAILARPRAVPAGNRQAARFERPLTNFAAPGVDGPLLVGAALD